VRLAEAAAACKGRARMKPTATGGGDSSGTRSNGRAAQRIELGCLCRRDFLDGQTRRDAGLAGLGARWTRWGQAAGGCGARQQGRQLTSFCAAPGAGSSLYFRGLSGACDCDIVITVLGGSRMGRLCVGPGADDEDAVRVQ
jgi:hypothetical protein